MKSLKTLLGIATDEITDEREKSAIIALKAALRRVEDANDALEALKNSIDDGSFAAPSAMAYCTYSSGNAFTCSQ